jgi:hypothetical protein
MRPARRDDTLGVMHSHLVAAALGAVSVRVLGPLATGADLEVGDEAVHGDVAFAMLPVGSEA